MRSLLQRAQAGDDEAFGQLFQQNAEALWRAAISLMRNEDQAADALQETAIKAWQSIPKFDGKSKLSTWLMRILINACYDELRAQKKSELVQDPAESLEAMCVQPTHADSVETRMDIDATLGALPHDDRLVLTLFYANDLPISEIASLLGVNEGAVRTRLVRARARFKNIYTAGSNTAERVSEVAS